MSLERNFKFAMISQAILEDERITAVDQSVFLAIASFAGCDRSSFPSYITIAKRAKVSKPTVSKSLKKLEEYGYIQVIRKTNKRGEKENNCYIINDLNNPVGSKGALPGVVKQVNQGSKGALLGVVKQVNYKNTNNKNTNKEYIDNVELDSTSIPRNQNEIEEVINYLNQKANTNYKANAKGNVKYIRARLSDGYTVADMKRVIDVKCAEWKGDPKMNQYLRPSTLFNSDKFEGYLNQKVVNQYGNNKRVVEPEFKCSQNNIMGNEELARLKAKLKGDV